MLKNKICCIMRFQGIITFYFMVNSITFSRSEYLYHVQQNVNIENGGEIRLDDNFYQTRVPRLSTCAMICAQNTSCLSAVYKLSTKTCFLFDTLHTCDFSESSTDHVLLQNICRPWEPPDTVECCTVPLENTNCGAPLYKDCQQAFEAGDRRDGQIYYLRPHPDYQIVKAVCQFDKSAGWTVIQRRLDGSVDFFRLWQEYVDGFGFLGGEYWMGLDSIHEFTKENQKISFLMEKHNGETKTANYSTFIVGSRDSDFILQIGGYSGDAGDSMAFHNGMMFSARDRDRDDALPGENCAEKFKGGWWYVGCHYVNINGIWQSTSRASSFAMGLNWKPWVDWDYSLKATQMRIGRSRY